MAGKSYGEHIANLEATRAEKSARMKEIHQSVFLRAADPTVTYTYRSGHEPGNAGGLPVITETSTTEGGGDGYTRLFYNTYHEIEVEPVGEPEGVTDPCYCDDPPPPEGCSDHTLASASDESPQEIGEHPAGDYTWAYVSGTTQNWPSNASTNYTAGLNLYGASGVPLGPSGS